MELIVKHLPDQDYESCFQAMKERTQTRVEQKKQGIMTPNELWIVEHKDVYTLGLAGKREHILHQTSTPVVQTDRGGQVTWHGEGQLVAYFLFDLNGLGWSVRTLVSHTENIICDVLNPLLAPHHLNAKPKASAPGVYIYTEDEIELGKIASLGFKIKHGFSYHGLAINVNCALSVFNSINPCGYAGMTMLNVNQFADITMDEMKKMLIKKVETCVQG